MAQDNVKVPLHPDVPQASGVPSIFRDPTKPVFTALLLVADVLAIAQFFQGPQWGIFTSNGGAFVVPDTILSVDFRREWTLADYPIETGGFETYNKVSRPYDVRIEMVCDGTNMDKSLFLSTLDTGADSLDLYTVAIPEGVFNNVNIIHYDFRRQREKGASIIIADVWLQQVIQTTSTQFSDTKDATSQGDVNKGTVQTETPPALAPSTPPTQFSAPLFPGGVS